MKVSSERIHRLRGRQPGTSAFELRLVAKLVAAAALISASCAATAPRAEAPRPAAFEASIAAPSACERPEHRPDTAELLALLPDDPREVVAVELAQLDGEGPWEALMLVNEGPPSHVVPKLYAFEDVGRTWSLIDATSFDPLAIRNEEEGAVAMRTAPLLGPCREVVWVDLDVSNWASREEFGDSPHLRRESSVVMLAYGRLHTRVTCQLIARSETIDEERWIEGTNVELSWSPDDLYPKPIRVRRRTGLAPSMNLEEKLTVIDAEVTYEVDGWARGNVSCHPPRH